MSKFVVDVVDIQITNRDDAGEYELEAFPVTRDENGLHETDMGLGLALDHQTGKLRADVDEDRWLEVTRSEIPDAPKGISEEVWERFLGVAFGRLQTLTGIGKCESCGEPEAFSGAENCVVCGGCDECGKWVEPGTGENGECSECVGKLDND